MSLEKLQPLRDARAIAALLRDVWQFGPADVRCFALQQRLLALRYVLKELTLCAEGLVLRKHGALQGVVLTASPQCRLPLGVRVCCILWRAACSLGLALLGHRFKYDYGNFEAIAQAKASTAWQYERQRAGQVLLLALHPSCHGHGLGRLLLQAGFERLSARGCRCAFLFTDSFCNFSFYDACGMTRAVDIVVPGRFGPRSEDHLAVRFLVYTQDLNLAVS